MTERDWRVFGDRLQQAFPSARYFSDIASNLQTASPPDISCFSALSAVPDQYPARAMMVFNRFSAPSVVRSTYLESEPEKWVWTVKPPPHPYVWLSVGVRVWDQQGPPHLGVGEIHFYMTPKDKEHEAIVRAFYRELAQCTTNRNLAFVRYPDHLVTPVEKGLDLWCGYDAIRWARDNPKRFLHFNGLSGLRPLDTSAQVVPFKKLPHAQKA